MYEIQLQTHERKSHKPNDQLPLVGLSLCVLPGWIGKGKKENFLATSLCEHSANYTIMNGFQLSDN